MSKDEFNHKYLAKEWFENLRDAICDSLEECERILVGGNAAAQKSISSFERTEWRRTPELDDGGGGVMSVLRGRVFEKVGVNVSTVEGKFSDEMRSQIPGTEDDDSFWASGISVVAHPRSPLVPIAHMNTRMIVTAKQWFGGGGDLTPVFPDDQDTESFHSTFRKVCDNHDKGYFSEGYYTKFKKWCDNYFYLPHRNEARGVGGIFFDYLDTGDWAADFSFVQDVGKGFLTIYPEIVKRHMNKDWSSEEVTAQLAKRARYVEFNLIHDRGTKFGLMTGGNTEAILMSLPPMAAWP